MNASDLDDLHYYAVKLEWNGSEQDKDIGRKIKELIEAYESACKDAINSDIFEDEEVL